MLYCAQEGSVAVDGVETTLLVAPMKGFYDIETGQENPGSTQFRISFVETPENIAKIAISLRRAFKEIRSPEIIWDEIRERTPCVVCLRFET